MRKFYFYLNLSLPKHEEHALVISDLQGFQSHNFDFTFTCVNQCYLRWCVCCHIQLTFWTFDTNTCTCINRRSNSKRTIKSSQNCPSVIQPEYSHFKSEVSARVFWSVAPPSTLPTNYKVSSFSASELPVNYWAAAVNVSDDKRPTLLVMVPKYFMTKSETKQGSL